MSQIPSTRPTSAASKPAFVLVHGAWHDRQTWSEVVPLLTDAGFASLTLDLPGAGEHALTPSSYENRPADPAAFGAAFGTEPSPNAGVTQEERTEAVIVVLREAAQLGNGQVVLVGHSLGGLTLSAVGEAVPNEVAALVYLTAFMLPPNMVAGEMIQSEVMSAAKVPGLFLADPEQVGALRLDPNSTDVEYRAAVRETFFADVSDDLFDVALTRLHPDEPAQVAGVPTPTTEAVFGSIARHYIRCINDQAIVVAGQDHMIDLVDAAMPTATVVHTLDSSHSSFYSQPETLLSVLSTIADSVGPIDG